jgi:MFS family permease
MKWLIVALLWGVALLNYLDRQVVFSLFPVIEKELHATPLQLGLIGTVFLWTYGLLSPFGGYLADRFGRVQVILASLAVWSVATWVTGHVDSMSGMLWSRGLMGASEAFYLPAALALIADRHTAGTRSLATGIHQSGLYTGLVIGGAWGGWMGEHAGWRPVFSILGVVGICYLLLLAMVLRQRAAGPTRMAFGASLTALQRRPGFAALTLAFTVMAIANWLIYTWLPLYLFERFHMSMTNAGFSATFYIQAASYAGVVAGGVLSDRWALRYPRARIYCQVAGLAIASPFLAALGFTGSITLLIAALIAFGVGRGLFDCNTMPILREVVGPDLSATGYGIFNMAGCIAGGVCAAVAGWMKETVGLGVAFPLSAMVLVVGCFLLLRVPRTV